MLQSSKYESSLSRGVFVRLWRRWNLRRERIRARRLSHTRYVVTREGIHFTGVLLLIFIGAVLRDLNLLILLAGLMIGLIFLQWRLGMASLSGLTSIRRLPDRFTVGVRSTVGLTLSNRKRWLGAWWIQYEDPIRKLAPILGPRKQGKGIAIVPEIGPQSYSDGRFDLLFHERGNYRIGPTTISTRFPFGLGIGWFSALNAKEIFVHPAQGILTRNVRQLLQVSTHGQTSASSHSGVHEAELYGLRTWRTGDSKRWIHWRTTARMGELSVRQFERRERHQANVLLDLYVPKLKPTSQQLEAIELAISFTATLVSHEVLSEGNVLSIAIAGEREICLPSIQSPTATTNLLDSLSIAKASSEPQLVHSLRSLMRGLLVSSHLLVISTRPSIALATASDDPALQRLLLRSSIHWLNVSNGDLGPYFSWTHKESNA